jgi:hypothetical protein
MWNKKNHGNPRIAILISRNIMLLLKSTGCWLLILMPGQSNVFLEMSCVIHCTLRKWSNMSKHQIYGLLCSSSVRLGLLSGMDSDILNNIQGINSWLNNIYLSLSSMLLLDNRRLWLVRKQFNYSGIVVGSVLSSISSRCILHPSAWRMNYWFSR